MGLPANETLVAGAFFAPDWNLVLDYGVQSVLDYFFGDNTQKVLLKDSRTTPVTLRQRRYPNGTVYEWTSAMMISTVTFPATSAIPEPIDPLKLEPVGTRLVAALQFNTQGLPTEADFGGACGGITQSTLPAGYIINLFSHWSPTLAIYSSKNAGVFECECWMEVIAV